MSDLAEFLLARIAEDEAAATAAQEAMGEGSVPDGAWFSDLDDSLGWWSDAAFEFAASMTPARVLAECEAKRRLVKYARSWEGELRDPDSPFADVPPRRAGTGVAVLRALAQVYRDHPDFNAHDWLI